MSERRFGGALLLFLAALGLGIVPFAAKAQVVGSIAALNSDAEVERDGNTSALSLGNEIFMRDRVRTNGTGRVKISFADGSVAIVSSNSDLLIDRHVYDPSTAGGSSVLELLKGKVRTIVSDYYSDAGEYEVKTPTATAGVRGTDFIVTYDPLQAVTEVVTASGRVYVKSIAATAAEGVMVTAGTQTVVARGQAPTAPTAVGEERFRYYMDDVDFIGRSGRQSLGLDQGILEGSDVPRPEQAQAAVAEGAENVDLDTIQGDRGGVVPDAAGLADQPPSALDFGRVGVDF